MPEEHASMKIAMVITGLGTGGAELSLVNLVNELRKRHQLLVISMGSAGPVAEHLQRLGVPVTALHAGSGISVAAAFVRLVRVLRAFGPDVVHTWMYHSDLAGGLAARLLGIRSVLWSLHCSDLSPERTKLRTRIVARACSWLAPAVPRSIVSCSAQAARVHVAMGYPGHKMHVIPNGFDVGRFSPDEQARRTVRQELAFPAEAPLVGLVARLDPHKNHLGFVRAARVVADHRPDVRFLLAGAGIDEGNASLRSAIDAAGLGDRFALLGQRSDIPRLMAALDVLVSASVAEAFPMVLGEAMSSGVPCVVTDAGDSAEIVADTGRVVAKGDMEGLGRALVELLGLPEQTRRELGLRARKRVMCNYAIASVANEYELVYTQLAAD